jgi:hypothetical protein
MSRPLLLFNPLSRNVRVSPQPPEVIVILDEDIHIVHQE